MNCLVPCNVSTFDVAVCPLQGSRYHVGKATPHRRLLQKVSRRLEEVTCNVTRSGLE